LALVVSSVVNTKTLPLYLQERFVSHFAGGWVGCQGWSVPPSGFGPWTIQPIASYSINCAIPATCHTTFAKKQYIFLDIATATYSAHIF